MIGRAACISTKDRPWTFELNATLRTLEGEDAVLACRGDAIYTHNIRNPVLNDSHLQSVGIGKFLCRAWNNELTLRLVHRENTRKRLLVECACASHLVLAYPHLAERNCSPFTLWNGSFPYMSLSNGWQTFYAFSYLPVADDSSATQHNALSFFCLNDGWRLWRTTIFGSQCQCAIQIIRSTLEHYVNLSKRFSCLSQFPHHLQRLLWRCQRGVLRSAVCIITVGRNPNGSDRQLFVCSGFRCRQCQK